MHPLTNPAVNSLQPHNLPVSSTQDRGEHAKYTSPTFFTLPLLFSSSSHAPQRKLGVDWLERKISSIIGLSLDTSSRLLLVKKIADQILYDHGLHRSYPFTEEMAQKLLACAKKDIIAYGGLKIWDSAMPEKSNDGANFIKFLLCENSCLFSYFTRNTLKAILLRQDPVFLLQARQELQNVLNRIAQLLQSLPPLCQKNMLLILLHHVITLLPFFEQPHDSKVLIPQEINGQWSLVSYNVERIQLTGHDLGPPLYALGLKPLTSQCPALLIFMGTPFPTASGAHLAISSDFTYYYGVGEIIYAKWGGDVAVHRWIHKIKSEMANVAIDAFGLSLGGSMALLALTHHPKDIRQVFAYNPTAISKERLKNYEEKIAHLAAPPEVTIYWQDNDYIPMIGDGWHPSWKLLRLISHAKQNLYFSHIRAFSTHQAVVAMQADIQKAHTGTFRKILNFSHRMLSMPLFYANKTFLLYRQIQYVLSASKQGM